MYDDETDGPMCARSWTEKILEGPGEGLVVYSITTVFLRVNACDAYSR